MNDHVNGDAADGRAAEDETQKSDEVRDDVAEKPGSDRVSHDHEDELVDEWGEESFPSSDPPAHY